jgi:putative N6-adenine-specific DNA methylase
MCGSGTIAIEAARIALDMPPQLKTRKFCFMNWPNYDADVYEKVLDEVYNNPRKEFKYKIKASDKSIQSLKYTQYNIKEAGLEGVIETERIDFFKADDVTDTTIITNPPYDERLKVDNINKFYKQIGDQLKQHCTDCQAWIISGNEEAIKSVGLKPNKKINLYNGPIESKYYNFGIYKGSAKDEEE